VRQRVAIDVIAPIYHATKVLVFENLDFICYLDFDIWNLLRLVER